MHRRKPDRQQITTIEPGAENATSSGESRAQTEVGQRRKNQRHGGPSPLGILEDTFRLMLVQSNHKNTHQNNTSDDAEQQTLRACLLRTC
jgi:hypothetical protein